MFYGNRAGQDMNYDAVETITKHDIFFVSRYLFATKGDHPKE